MMSFDQLGVLFLCDICVNIVCSFRKIVEFHVLAHDSVAKISGGAALVSNVNMSPPAKSE